MPCWYFQIMEAVTPLVLGVIAAALAESDDSFRGRLRQILVVLACFALVSFSVEILFDLPWLFATGLWLTAFGFTMLGAVGSRYQSIAFASLLLAVYTMLGASNSQDIWTQPLLLLSAAAWHSLLSLLWYALAPQQPIQQSLARVFEQLERYLALKARLFEPVTGFSSHQHRLQLARHNQALVAALNHARQTLVSRVRQGRPGQGADRYLRLYFVAQDIHERASSSHYRYDELGETFRYSDILFRFQSLLSRQAEACGALSQAIRLRQPYQHSEEGSLVLNDTRQSLDHLRNQQQRKWLQPLTSLKYLLHNLATVERQLANADKPQSGVDPEQDNTLADAEVHSLSEMWQQLRAALSPRSLLLRHAVRLATALTLGYALIQLLEFERGYWILLTILFVTRGSFGATRKRMSERMLGTLAGLLLGIPLLYLFPGQEGQLVLMVLCGVAFFATRTSNYLFATGFITLLVLLCFDQLGEGYAVILPRLSDTLIGCLLSVLAVRFILPDWQIRHMPEFMARAVKSNRNYLSQIIAQYRIGKRDDLAYRAARRRAHDHDAELSEAISNMLQEPGQFRHAVDESFRMLVLNHALLGYISALGAHRHRLDDHDIHLLVNHAHEQICQRLDLISVIFAGKAALPFQATESGIEIRLSKWRQQGDDITRLVLQQLFMIHRLLDEMTELAMEVAGCDTELSKTA